MNGRNIHTEKYSHREIFPLKQMFIHFFLNCLNQDIDEKTVLKKKSY